MFVDNVPGKKEALVFPRPADGIVEHFASQGTDDRLFGQVRHLSDIVHIDAAVKVQAARQRLVGRQLAMRVRLRECHGFAQDVGLDNIPAELHFEREHLRAEAVEHDKLPVVVVVETAPFGDEGIVAGVELRPQCRVFLLLVPLPAGEFEICLADGEIVGGPVRVDLAFVHRHEIDGDLLIMIGLAVAERTYLPLEGDHRAVLHPLLRRARVGPPPPVGPRRAGGRHPEQGHLHGRGIPCSAGEQLLAETAGEIVAEQRGEVLRHGGFVAQPLIFAHLLAVPVHDDAAVCGEGGLRQGKKSVRGFGHDSCRVGFLPDGLQKHLLPQRECRFAGVLLEYEQVAADFDAARG